MKKEPIQITKAEAISRFGLDKPVKVLNEKTGKIRNKNASKEEIFDKNFFYFRIP